MPSKKTNADKSTGPAAGATVTPATPPAATGLNISAEALESSATTTSTPDDSAASSPSGDDAAAVAAGSGSDDQPSASAPGDGSTSVAGDANPPAALASEAGPASATPPAAETGSVTPPPPVSAGPTAAAPASAPLPPFAWETARTVEIPAAVPVVAPAVVDAIAAVPDDHRSDYRQLISSLAAVNHGLHNATHALTALRNLCRNDSGRELLVARGIDTPAVLTRLFHFLDVPDAD